MCGGVGSQSRCIASSCSRPQPCALRAAHVASDGGLYVAVPGGGGGGGGVPGGAASVASPSERLATYLGKAREKRRTHRRDVLFLSLLLSPPGQEATSCVSPGRELQTIPGGHTRPERRAVRADARSVSGGERVRVERHEVRRAHVDRVDDDEREALLGDCLRERALANERTNERNERRTAAPGWDHIASDRA